MEISKILTISTAHISAETERRLRRTTSDGLFDFDMPVAYEKGEYGYWIHVPESFPFLEGSDEECDIPCIPEDLWNCMKLAKNEGCSWLCLDRDGDVLDELPEYNWEEQKTA